MIMEHPSHHQQAKDEKLLFSLNYQQLESVIQFVYKVTFKENWIDVAINVDNMRCDVIQLVSETLMAKQGYSSDRKHFPSRILLQLTPLAQSDILSLSVRRQPGARSWHRQGHRHDARRRAGVYWHQHVGP